MSGTLECACGHTMTLERPEDAPWCCPKCGGGRIPDGMSRQAQRRAKAEFAKAKLKLGRDMVGELDKLRAHMDAMAKNGVSNPTFLNTPNELHAAGIIDAEAAARLNDPEPAA